MIRERAREFDNRDAGQVHQYLEARIEAMSRRIKDLERENARLTYLLLVEDSAEGKYFVASA